MLLNVFHETLTLFVIGVIVLATGSQGGVSLDVLVIKTEEGGQAAAMATAEAAIPAGVAATTGAGRGGGCVGAPSSHGGGSYVPNTSPHFLKLELLYARLNGDLV